MKYIEVKEWKGTDWTIEKAAIYEAQTILCNKEGAEWWNDWQRAIADFDTREYLINYKEGYEEYALSYKTMQYEAVEYDS